MKASRILTAVAVLLVIAGLAYTIKNREKTFGDAARTEAQAQQAEVAKCKEQMTAIHTAWTAYRKTHKGGEPGPADLAKSLKDASILICPTAQRWNANGKPLRSGSLQIGDKSLNPSYGFLWASAQGPHNFRKYGDKAPMMNCTAHQEGLYKAGYNRTMPEGAFSAENRPKLIDEVAAAKTLVLLRNGTVEEHDDEE